MDDKLRYCLNRTSMKLFLISGILTILAVQGNGQLTGVPKCSEAEAQQFAMCSVQPLVMNMNSTFPSDFATANSYCRQARASIGCIKAFSAKCLENLPKQAAEMVNQGYSKHLRNMCKTPQNRRELGEKLKCNNQAMAKLDSHMVSYIDLYRRVPFMESAEKLAGLCCGYYRFLDNVLTESSKVCSESDSEFLNTFIGTFASDAVAGLCKDVPQDAPICGTIQYPERTVEGEPSVSYMPPMLNVLGNL
ncbi:hypothetical protein HDE_14544 [Halotydeus destructor]|nr:hypothetical protein HDE_14544 [Halotydeus destructor]